MTVASAPSSKPIPLTIKVIRDEHGALAAMLRSLRMPSVDDVWVDGVCCCAKAADETIRLAATRPTGSVLNIVWLHHRNACPDSEDPKLNSIFSSVKWLKYLGQGLAYIKDR